MSLLNVSELLMFLILFISQHQVTHQRDGEVSEDSRQAIMNAVEVLLHKQGKLENRVKAISKNLTDVSAKMNEVKAKAGDQETEAEKTIKELKKIMTSALADVKEVARLQTEELSGKLVGAVGDLLKSSRKLSRGAP